MKILNTQKTRELDAYTIQHEPIPSIDLMEKASKAFVGNFIEKIDRKKKVYVFCGLGNNGGDGLAIARLLIDVSFQVETYIVRYSDKTSEDFDKNFRRLQELKSPCELTNITHFPNLRKADIIIDAIFGSGLTKPVEGFPAAIIQKINQSGATIVSVDIASGLFADNTTKSKNIIQPNYTIAFQLPKIAFLLPQNEVFVGEWEIVAIGLNEQLIEKLSTSYQYVDINFIKNIYKKRTKFSHKGTYGHALIIAGSYGKMGAAILNAKACLHTGVGLVTMHVPTCGYEIIQIACPEAMISTDKEKKIFSDIPFKLDQFAAIGIGSGLDKKAKTVEGFKMLLQKAEIPLVIDADALNILAENPDLLPLVPPNSILTPHPKEFERLIGRKIIDDFEKLEILKQFAQKYTVFVVLKGAHTQIATPTGEIYFNSTGNPGMATAGSGDVLTGIITSLLAQQYTSQEASILGVFLHGLAGDLAAQDLSMEGMIASDIINYLGEGFKKLG